MHKRPGFDSCGTRHETDMPGTLQVWLRGGAGSRVPTELLLFELMWRQHAV